MLSGKTRIRLLHHICNHPGDHVSAMAKTMGIGVSAASQELRRIQSRGILQTEYRGAKLIYRLGADPLVYSALRSSMPCRPASQPAGIRKANGCVASPKDWDIANGLRCSARC